MRGLALRAALRVEPLPFGVAVFDERLPQVWDLNLVWVDTVPVAQDARALALELERVQAAAGLTHRHAIVADGRGGERVAPGLTALGWGVRRRVLMAHRRPASAGGDGAAVRELTPAEARTFLERSLAEDTPELTPGVERQIVEARDVLAAAGARAYGALAGDAVVSACDLHESPGVAQIESVMTLPTHRGRGLASAVVLHAIARARDAGRRLVFLQAEEDGPTALYERLGFDPIGTVWVLERRL